MYPSRIQGSTRHRILDPDPQHWPALFCKAVYFSSNFANGLTAGLRIRIHLIRIRFQHFRLNTDSDPDPLRIRIQSESRIFDDQKLGKKLLLKKKLNFFADQTTIYLSLDLHKRRPSYKRSLQLSKKNIQHFKTWNFVNFSYFCGSFLPSLIWIQIPNTDKDPLTRLNPDPIGIRMRNPVWQITIFQFLKLTLIFRFSHNCPVFTVKRSFKNRFDHWRNGSVSLGIRIRIWRIDK